MTKRRTMFCIAAGLVVLSTVSVPGQGRRAPKRAVVRQESKLPQTVVDYYLLLPKKYFGGDLSDERARLSYIKVRDVRSGYLKIQKPYSRQKTKANDPERDLIFAEDRAAYLSSFVEIALFRKSSGGDVIAVTFAGGSDATITINQDINFLEYDAGQWRDTTDEVLSNINPQMAYAAYVSQGKPGDKVNPRDTTDFHENEFNYLLPRYGKSIKVIIDPQWTTVNQVELLTMTWRNDGFVIEPVLHRKR